MDVNDTAATSRPVDAGRGLRNLNDRPNRKRKSKGKGLRVRTGCLTCKARHLKCDEAQPICTACQKASRDCAYPSERWQTSDLPRRRERHSQDTIRVHVPSQPTNETLQLSPNTPAEADEPFFSSLVHETRQAQADDSLALRNHTVEFGERLAYAAGDSYPPSPLENPVNNPADHCVTNHDAAETNIAYDAELFGLSPGSSLGGWPSISAEAASRWWFELLASDVTSNHLIEPSRGFSVRTYDTAANTIFDADQAHQNPVFEQTIDSTSLAGQLDTSSKDDVVFTQLELELLHHFVSQLSGWIDTTDPDKYFAVVVPQMALRNKGLASAILALSARHISLNQISEDSRPSLPVSQTMAVQYYNDSLRYLQREMTNAAFLTSDELLAIVLIISTYEMIDGPGASWEKHLKGVFWIQRSQTIHGESEGLKKRIWWAWLRQDIWAAFRGRRRILSFYKLTRPCASLSFWELVDRAVYILGQCVNYASAKEEENGHINLQQRLDQSVDLGAKLQEWALCFEKYDRRLPTVTRASMAFKPIFINPPAASLAIQVHNFSKTILLEYKPAPSGLKELAGRQNTLKTAVDTVCGIACCTYEDGPTILSTQCVYGVINHVRDAAQREHVLNILQSHRERTGWPHSDIKEEVRRIWRSDEGPGS